MHVSKVEFLIQSNFGFICFPFSVKNTHYNGFWSSRHDQKISKGFGFQRVASSNSTKTSRAAGGLPTVSVKIPKLVEVWAT